MSDEGKVELVITHKSMVKSDDQLLCLACTSIVWPESFGGTIDLVCDCDRSPVGGRLPQDWVTVDRAQELARTDG